MGACGSRGRSAQSGARGHTRPQSRVGLAHGADQFDRDDMGGRGSVDPFFNWLTGPDNRSDKVINNIYNLFQKR
jgi:hypothetical protein